MTAARSRTPKVIDGDFSDWGCSIPFELTPENAELVTKTTSTASLPNVVSLRLEWDQGALYVAAIVRDEINDGDASGVDIVRNDSLEIYLATLPLIGDYRATDGQYVIDYRNETASYSAGLGRPKPQHLQSAVKRTADGFAVEARFSVDAVGLARFDATMAFGFNFGANDGSGSRDAMAPAGTMVWAYADHEACTCGRCCCTRGRDADPPGHPYCDTLRFGRLNLQ